MTRIYFCRHAQSEFNAGLNRNFNSAITPQGIEQAHRLGSHLKNRDLKGYVGYVSPYYRCLQTALVIYQYTDLKFKVLSGLGETPDEMHRSYGVVYGAGNAFPEMDWSAFPGENRGYYDYRETMDQYRDRLHKTLDEIVKGPNAVIVSHMTPIRHMIQRLCYEGREESLQIGNCSVSLVENGHPLYVGMQV